MNFSLLSFLQKTGERTLQKSLSFQTHAGTSPLSRVFSFVSTLGSWISLVFSPLFKQSWVFTVFHWNCLGGVPHFHLNTTSHTTESGEFVWPFVVSTAHLQKDGHTHLFHLRIGWDNIWGEIHLGPNSLRMPSLATTFFLKCMFCLSFYLF